MLTDRVPNMKYIQEHTEDALYCSDEYVQGWLLVQEYVGGGYLSYKFIRVHQMKFKLIYNCLRRN